MMDGHGIDSIQTVSLNHYFNDDTSCTTEGIEQLSLTQTTTLSGPSELPKRQVCTADLSTFRPPIHDQ